MIGRDGPTKPFELIRWARKQAHPEEDEGPPRLRPVEAHVLLILATYANKDAVCWPSIRALAEDAGLKVKEVKRRDRKTGPRKTYENSGVSAALQRLQELQLIWRTEAGRGRSARTELLFKPSATPETKKQAMATGQPEATEGPRSPAPRRPSRTGLASGLTEDGLRPDGGEVPGTTSTATTTTTNGHKKASATAEALNPSPLGEGVGSQKEEGT